MLRYGGDESSRWDERCMYAHLHSNAQVNIENMIECVKSVGKMNHTFGLKLSSPYIGVCVCV